MPWSDTITVSYAPNLENQNEKNKRIKCHYFQAASEIIRGLLLRFDNNFIWNWNEKHMFRTWVGKFSFWQLIQHSLKSCMCEGKCSTIKLMQEHKKNIVSGNMKMLQNKGKFLPSLTWPHKLLEANTVWSKTWPTTDVISEGNNFIF